MKLSTIAVVSVALFSSVNSFAGTLSVSPNIELLALDGHKVKKGFFSKQKSLEISDNDIHQAVISVTEIIKQGNDQVLYESDPIVVTFHGNAHNVVLSVPRLTNQFELNEFKQNHYVNVTTQDGQKISSQQAKLPQEGFFPGLNLIENIAKYNVSKGNAAVSAFAAIKTVVPTENAVINSSSYQVNKEKLIIKGQNIAEQQLQYWYQQADKATQLRFLKWAQTQK